MYLILTDAYLHVEKIFAEALKFLPENHNEPAIKKAFSESEVARKDLSDYIWKHRALRQRHHVIPMPIDRNSIIYWKCSQTSDNWTPLRIVSVTDDNWNAYVKLCQGLRITPLEFTAKLRDLTPALSAALSLEEMDSARSLLDIAAERLEQKWSQLEQLRNILSYDLPRHKNP